MRKTPKRDPHFDRVVTEKLVSLRDTGFCYGDPEQVLAAALLEIRAYLDSRPRRGE